MLLCKTVCERLRHLFTWFTLALHTLHHSKTEFVFNIKAAGVSEI